VPYEGTEPIPDEELRDLDRETDVDRIWLKDGRILIPRHDYEGYKEWVGKLKALRERER